MSKDNKNQGNPPVQSAQAPASQPLDVSTNVNVNSLVQAIIEGLRQGLSEQAITAKVAEKSMKDKEAEVMAARRVRCGVCRQPQNACKGEHVKIAVYPQNRRNGKWFQGVRINGTKYLSNSHMHKIFVPKVAVGEILYAIAEWEKGEDELKTGKEVEHNSGVIGANGTKGFVPARQAWR